MAVKKNMGLVGIKSGLVFEKKNGNSVESLNDAQEIEAKCGCGISCCDQELVLTDRTTQDHMAVYFDNGSMYVKNKTTGDVFEATLTPLES